LVIPQHLQPEADTNRVPGEIVIKLRKTSQAAAVLDSAVKRGKAAKTALAEANELSALLKKHKVSTSKPNFSRAKRETGKGGLKANNEQATKRDALFRWCRLQLPSDADLQTALAEFKANPAVEYAEPAYEWRLAQIIDPPITGLPDSTTDPMISQQWHHSAVRAQAAWNYLKLNGAPMGGYSDVVVAVIDTGTDYNHQDLVGNIWTNPREIPGNGIDDDANGFIDDIHGCAVTSDSRSHSGDPIDLHGHGTHVAGIIASTAFNHLGGVGLAFGVKVMPIRAAHYSGNLTTTDIAEGILYAVDNGTDVINITSVRVLVIEHQLVARFAFRILQG
jgi:subtilisin family serine protease